MCLVCRRSLHHRGTEAQRKVLLHLNPPRLCASVVRKLFTNWRQSRGRGLFAKLADALPKVPSERCVLGLAIEAVHFARIFPEVVELEFLRRPPRATPAFSLQHQGKFRNLIIGRVTALLLLYARLPSAWPPLSNCRVARDPRLNVRDDVQIACMVFRLLVTNSGRVEVSSAVKAHRGQRPRSPVRSFRWPKLEADIANNRSQEKTSGSEGL